MLAEGCAEVDIISLLRYFIDQFRLPLDDRQRRGSSYSEAQAKAHEREVRILVLEVSVTRGLVLYVDAESVAVAISTEMSHYFSV